MSQFVTAYEITIPPNTAAINPKVVNMPLGNSNVDSFTVIVPPGPSGQVGFSIWSGGTQTYPTNPQTWFIFDDYIYEQDVTNQINSGSWQFYCYNADQFQHVLQVYIAWDYYTPPTTTSTGLAVGV